MPPFHSRLVKLGGHTPHDLAIHVWQTTRWSRCPKAAAGSTWKQYERRDRLLRAGVVAPEWGDVDRGQRPGSHPDDEFPRFSHMGWQSFASSEIEEVFLTPPCATASWFDPQSQGPPSASPLVPAPFVFCNLPVWPAT